VKIALPSRTTRSTNDDKSRGLVPPVNRGSSPPRSQTAAAAPSCLDAFDVGSFAIVRQFVEHIMDKNATTLSDDGERSLLALDWEAVEASISDSRSIEHAIGRAVVIADHTSRGLCDEYLLRHASPWPAFEDPFFSFSMENVLPDFGDESRYRSRVRRKVARIFGTRRAAVGMAVPGAEEAPPSSALLDHDDRTVSSG
jgi:hypothetical protein